MVDPVADPGEDTHADRKARGAFFTAPEITQFIARWAIRTDGDKVLEPSCGDAEFMVAATARLLELGVESPVVHGVEIHPPSARRGASRVAAAGGRAELKVADFFTIHPEQQFDAVIGNPPYVRYQEFSGASRARSREAALRAGVSISALASSWAAFTVHATLFLRTGGRLGLVLPAELLSVNYASTIRRFLFDSFRTIELVMFEEQVFADAEADVVLVLADGYGQGPASCATVYSTKNAYTLRRDVQRGLRWTPEDPAAKWTTLLIDPEATEPLRTLMGEGAFVHLERWGRTALGMVTGSNAYFTMSPARVRELGIPRRELVRLSPPGSSHLRGLELSHSALRQLGREGQATWMFRPRGDLSDAARAYIEQGVQRNVDLAYKCRIRRKWYEVPLVPPADLFLTYMNADTPRLTTNAANAYHLNSIHGVYLDSDTRVLGRELLPLASLNSLTLLHAEVVGRSYGGGVLKLEPREADIWDVPSPALVAERATALRAIRASVERALGQRDLLGAVELVDGVLFAHSRVPSRAQLNLVRDARAALHARRSSRARRGV